MSIEQFIQELEQGIGGLEPGQLKATTRFQDLPEWDSLAVLATLATVDAAFGIQVSAQDIRQCQTVEDLYNLARTRTA